MNLLFASKDSPCVVEARSFKSTTRRYRIHILQVTFFRNLSQLIPSNSRIQKTPWIIRLFLSPGRWPARWLATAMPVPVWSACSRKSLGWGDPAGG